MRKRIRSFTDLEVYQNTYYASVTVLTKILLKLPKSERFDLVDQLRRSAKAIPRLIAEGFQKYLDDAAGESNETIVSLCHTRDVYNVEPELITQLIDTYDKASRQLYKLSCAWESFGPRKTKPRCSKVDDNVSPFETDQR